MKYLLRSEELMQFAASIALLGDLGAAWWWYPVLLLGPDVGMLGYLAGPHTGSWTYNLFHHKGLALILSAAGFLLASNVLLFAGLCMFGHASMDRMLGYGLKFTDDFKHTHLGSIGRAA